MVHTWLSDRFDLRVPVVNAPMAGVASGRLAAAVSSAGGLGMFGVGVSADADRILADARVAAASGRPFGVGLTAWALRDHPEQVQATAECGASLVSVSFGDYADTVPPLKEAGVLVATQVGTLEEAREAEQAGVDVVVARGAEGGGHGRDAVATLPLLQLVLDAVHVPVLAAGGIGSPRSLAAVLAAGAAGAWVGTAFAACPESDSSPQARRRLLEASTSDTVYGRVFDVAQGLAWPEQFGGRALRNRYFDRWVGREAELAGDPSAAAELREAKQRRDFDTAYLYAGEGVGQLRSVSSAAQVIDRLAGAQALLQRAARPALP